MNTERPRHSDPLRFVSDDAEEWLKNYRVVVGTAEAARRLGVTPAALRRTLARYAEPPGATRVAGICSGERFLATRPKPGRGVPWGFVFPDREASAYRRIAEHRSLITRAEEGAEVAAGRRGSLRARLLFWRRGQQKSA